MPFGVTYIKYSPVNMYISFSLNIRKGDCMFLVTRFFKGRACPKVAGILQLSQLSYNLSKSISIFFQEMAKVSAAQAVVDVANEVMAIK